MERIPRAGSDQDGQEDGTPRRRADLRNVYSEEEAKEGGFEVYVGIGR